MINAVELRIGNWLHRYGVNMEVNEINQYGKNGCPTINGWDEEDFIPIVITPDILIKCGFEKIRSNVPDLMETDSFDTQRQFRWDSIDGLAIQTAGSGWIWRLPHIEYLHQFQNLYSIVVNKELTISNL